TAVAALAIDAEAQSNARAMLHVVMGELSEMNPRRAQAVLLHDIEGYDLEEIATMTEISVAAAQSRLVRGRKELLKRLDAHEKRAKLRRSGEWVERPDVEDAPRSPREQEPAKVVRVRSAERGEGREP